MPAAIKFDSKILLAKIEVTYATDVVPTGAADAVLAKNIELRPMEGQDVSRELEQPYIGAQEELPVGLYSVLTYEVEAVGSGSTGVAPAWGPLMRSCGVAEVVTEDDDPGDVDGCGGKRESVPEFALRQHLGDERLIGGQLEGGASPNKHGERE